MITTKTMALMIATAVLGVGSPLAAMAQVPEVGDTNLSGVIGIPADVPHRLLDNRLGDVVAETEQLIPDVCQILIENPDPLIGTASNLCLPT